MSIEEILLEAPAEIHRFLQVTCQPYKPVLSLDQVLEDVVSAIGVLSYGDQPLEEVAIQYAFDTDQEYRIEVEDIPTGPRRDTFEAVLELGKGLRSRLEELKAYSGPEGWFPFQFQKVYRDELILFTKIPIDNDETNFGLSL